MALHGDLRTMSVAELLQWAAFYNKTGVLEVERLKIRRLIAFRDGRIVGCLSDDPSMLLGQFLISRGKITERQLHIAAETVMVAQELDVTPSQVAIAWVRAGEGNIIPLVGARTQAQLEENLGALDVTLASDQLERLNEVSSISSGFPHDMLQPQAEATARRLDNHRAAFTPEW